MRFMVINSTLPSPPPPNKKERKKKRIQTFAFSCFKHILPLFFNVLGYWDQKNQSRTTHVQQNTVQALICSVYFFVTSILFKSETKFKPK